MAERYRPLLSRSGGAECGIYRPDVTVCCVTLLPRWSLFNPAVYKHLGFDSVLSSYDLLSSISVKEGTLEHLRYPL